jgi:hypothetical protein
MGSLVSCSRVGTSEDLSSFVDNGKEKEEASMSPGEEELFYTPGIHSQTSRRRTFAQFMHFWILLQCLQVICMRLKFIAVVANAM